MDLCVTSHRLLYDIANRTEAERFNRIVCRVGNEPPRSLADILRDYVANLRLRRALVRTWGDIPVGTLNRLTGKIMDVENPRGRAYAARNRAAYRRAKS